MMNMNVEKVSRLSSILFDIDPVNTCCKENDCFDEYDGVAYQIVELIEAGESVDNAIVEVFKDSFSVDLDDSIVDAIVEVFA